MAHWAKEILGNSLAASWAQAAAAIILVVITAWYVRVTRGMAAAARDQADRTAAGWDRSYEDGLKQQQQLVKRQAVDKARAELGARMSTSLQYFRDAYSTLDSVYDAYDETAVFAEVATLKERGLRGQYAERFGRVSEEARADLDLKYLADYPSVFPLSDELVIRFAVAGYNLGMGWNWARLYATQAMDRGAEPSASETEAMTQFMRDALDLIVRLDDLMAQVQRTGYARVFGDLPLDSKALSGESAFLVEGSNGWDLQVPLPDVFDHRSWEPPPRI